MTNQITKMSAGDDAVVLDARVGDRDLNLRYADVECRPETRMYWQESQLIIRVVGARGDGAPARDGAAAAAAARRRLHAIMRTRCDVTAAALRHELDWRQGKATRWLSVECADSGVCQVEYSGGDHWITYVPHSGHVYHSWMGRFMLRRDCVRRGAMTRAKALEVAESLGFVDELQPCDDDDDIVIYARIRQ